MPAVVADVAARWQLRLGAAFEPGGVSSYVVRATSAAGERCVLKVRWRHFEADDEAAGLRAWAGDGVVRLLSQADIDEWTDVLLLEACEPGHAAGSLPEPEQDELVAGLLRRLWAAPPAPTFRPLAGMCASWADGLDVEMARQRLGDDGLVRAGTELFRQLPTEASAGNVLLATDLHAGNILAAQREPWLVIDPKPYVGDPTYDVLQHLLNCGERLAADPPALIARMARLLDLDPDRLALWLFARCVIECDERPDLAAVARRLRP